MKKFLGILFLILICTIICVSATNSVNHDFGNFTADIPADSDIKSYHSAVMHNVDSRSLSSSNIQSAVSNARDKYVSYEDGKNDITYKFLNSTANGNYSENVIGDEISNDNGLICFNDTGNYYVVKQQDGFLFWPGECYVIIEGSDLNLLKEIGQTVKFK